MNEEEIMKASSCCMTGNCSRCPLDCVLNCRTALREGMHEIVSKQQFELVLKRNTINDLNNKLTEKQSENEKLQSLCTSKDVIIKEQEAEIERLQNALDDVLDSQLLLIEGAEKYVIKEFAERLKMKAYLDNGLNGFLRSMVIDVNDIDNLLAELVGGENEKNN